MLMAQNQGMSGKQAKRWFVSGSVQGVGFRFFVQHKAAALGLAGWARNLDDGRVEVYASGSPERLSDLAAALHAGPRMAAVRGVEEQEAEPDGACSFSIR
jgi:acylphosphatase